MLLVLVFCRYMQLTWNNFLYLFSFPLQVKQLGNKSVSWIRLRDGHILTVDR